MKFFAYDEGDLKGEVDIAEPFESDKISEALDWFFGDWADDGWEREDTGDEIMFIVDDCLYLINKKLED